MTGALTPPDPKNDPYSHAARTVAASPPRVMRPCIPAEDRRGPDDVQPPEPDIVPGAPHASAAFLVPRAPHASAAFLSERGAAG